ncbi:MAG: VanZ family protein [Bacteroidales bacterium]|nr:VanZ family protein [Bacteroidales bacterium]
MSKGQRIAFQFLFFLYLAGILFLCFWHFESLPTTPSALFGIPMDKLVHCAMFLPFPVLAFLAFDRYTDTAKRTFLFVGITMAIGLLLAAGTEWGQSAFTEYRSGDPLDFLADAAGLLVSCVIVTIWDIRKQRS